VGSSPTAPASLSAKYIGLHVPDFAVTKSFYSPWHRWTPETDGGLMPEGEIAVDDLRTDDVQLLLERHLTFARSHTPPGDVQPLEVESQVDPDTTLSSELRALMSTGHET
jgi:hypothetical protein